MSCDMWLRVNIISKQGQGNNFQNPGVKFEVKTGIKRGNKMKREELGRNRKTGRRKKTKTGRNWMLLKETGRKRKKQEKKTR